MSFTVGCGYSEFEFPKTKADVVFGRSECASNLADLEALGGTLRDRIPLRGWIVLLPWTLWDVSTPFALECWIFHRTGIL